MTSSQSLQDEVSKLRADAGKDRARKKRRSTRARQEEQEPEVPEVEETHASAAEEKLKQLSSQLDDLVHNTEDGIRDHPVAAVLGAFALGIVVGAVLRR
ncbi:MAG: hypothetical protein JJ979_25460 [Roseibium sp.]|nr:hypothetical protein [Roseibium sp.]